MAENKGDGPSTENANVAGDGTFLISSGSVGPLSAPPPYDYQPPNLNLGAGEQPVLPKYADVNAAAQGARVPTKPEDTNLTNQERPRTVGTRGVRPRQSWWWDMSLTNPAWNLVIVLFTLLLIFALVGLLILTSSHVMETCSWPLCVQNKHHRTYGGQRSGPALQTLDSCVFRRFVPHNYLNMMELIHDYGSKWSAMIEWKRCILFDMHHYYGETCPTKYPSNLDERLGVPSYRSAVSFSYPRRFARYRFTRAGMTHAETVALLQSAGSKIAKRCIGRSVFKAVTVESAMEDVHHSKQSQSAINLLLASLSPNFKARVFVNKFGSRSLRLIMYEPSHIMEEVTPVAKAAPQPDKAMQGGNENDNTNENHHEDLHSPQKNTVATEDGPGSKVSLLNVLGGLKGDARTDGDNKITGEPDSNRLIGSTSPADDGDNTQQTMARVDASELRDEFDKRRIYTEIRRYYVRRGVIRRICLANNLP